MPNWWKLEPLCNVETMGDNVTCRCGRCCKMLFIILIQQQSQWGERKRFRRGKWSVIFIVTVCRNTLTSKCLIHCVLIVTVMIYLFCEIFNWRRTLMSKAFLCILYFYRNCYVKINSIFSSAVQSSSLHPHVFPILQNFKHLFIPLHMFHMATADFHNRHITHTLQCL